jgi:hypothetical protein
MLLLFYTIVVRNVMSCPYKYFLGIPGQGIHSVRFMGFAVVDIVLTLLLAWVSARWLNSAFLTMVVVWFVVGEVLHYVFGTQTAVLTALGIQACPSLHGEKGLLNTEMT